MADGSNELWREIALKVKSELQEIKDKLMLDLIHVDLTAEELKAEMERREQAYFMNPAHRVQVNRVCPLNLTKIGKGILQLPPSNRDDTMLRLLREMTRGLAIFLATEADFGEATCIQMLKFCYLE